uniref:Transthyretin-like protein 5 n=1 Tax=Acrobeloides nanus TaxID=290746 RepID=A0A914EQD4_9BILA
MQILALVLLYSIPLSVVGVGLGITQSSGVKGKLMCNDKPAVGVTVKLYDDDRGIDSDDLMASGKTDGQGQFSLKGHTEEFTTIDPKLNIYHDCEDGIKPCQRKVTIKIPDGYVSQSENPKKIYDAGTLQLAGKFPGEERDCLH